MTLSLNDLERRNEWMNQSLFAAISKYSVTVVNRQLWTGQWGQSTNHCPLKKKKKKEKKMAVMLLFYTERVAFESQLRQTDCS